ncbi:hypothetical protein SXANM310S_03768 [Streptomyces xanthochromogenes]
MKQPITRARSFTVTHVAPGRTRTEFPCRP